MGCIYCATNTINNKIYIGKTIRSLEYRKAQHKRDKRSKTKFKNAINKYGFENFEFVSLFESTNENELNEKEKLLIYLFNSKNENVGYNLADGGNSNSGWKMSEETKKKLSESHKSPRAKKKIIAYDKNENKIGEFFGQNEVANYFRIKRTSIGNNINNRSKFVKTYLGKIKLKLK